MEVLPVTPSQQKLTSTGTRKRLPIVFIWVLLLVLVGIGGYFFGRQSTQEKIKKLRNIEKVYTFENSEGKIKKIAFFTNKVNQYSTGHTVYLTDEFVDISTGVELFKSKYLLPVYNVYFPESQKADKFLLEIQNQGDGYPELLLFNDEGKPINKEVFNSKTSESVAQDIRKNNPSTAGQISIKILGFQDQSDVFSVKLMSVFGKEFIIDFDGNTGEYIKGSVRSSTPSAQ